MFVAFKNDVHTARCLMVEVREQQERKEFRSGCPGKIWSGI